MFEEFKPLDRCQDEELIRLFREGVTEAFGVLVRRYQRELFGYLERYLGDRAAAEDVFQNTFLQVYQKLDQYQAERPFRPWLYTVATHQAIDAMRRAGRRPSVSLDVWREQGPNGQWVSLTSMVQSAAPDPSDSLDEAERRQWVRASVAALPEKLRMTLILAYYQGLRYQEIAEVLGIPVGTVKSRLHAALVRLQRMWSNRVGDMGGSR
ncbi:MAG: RNA polymerase subunit sigma-70 [Gemmataceae bacterium]